MKKFLASFGKPRFLGILPLTEEQSNRFRKGDSIVVRTNRGEEIISVIDELTDEQEVEYRSMRTSAEHGEGPIRGSEPAVSDLEYVRPATEADIESYERHTEDEDEAFRVARDLLKTHNLPMKLIDVEYILDKKKLFLYFTSEQRVDFRTLVKDLAREFRTRIELRQVGIRDEAKIIKGLSSCGRPCCCSYWLHQFSPIGIRMVKEQNLALNPAKISGICGRLMCCMCYEHNVYKEMWAGLPGPGSKLKTPNGNCVVLGIDVKSKAVRCYVPGSGEVAVPVQEFPTFRETVTKGETWTPTPKEPEEAPAATKFQDFGGRELGRRPKPIEEKSREAARTEQQGPGGEEEKPSRKRRRRSRSRKGRQEAPASTEQQKAAPQQPQQETAQPEKQQGQPAGESPARKRRRRRRKPRGNAPESGANPSNS